MHKNIYAYHNLIRKALDNFNPIFLLENNVLFGGGTRIALEINEYRLSVDIDFICPNKESYRSVRQEVSNVSLGNIVRKDFVYLREIKQDRDSVRCFIEINNNPIKLEFISFADYNLNKDIGTYFNIPYIDRKACYTTKLLANADRYNNSPYKDIFDLLAMFDNWGDIPRDSWKEADNHYSSEVIMLGLDRACSLIKDNENKYIKIATEELSIDEFYARHLIHEVSNNFVEHINAFR